MTNPTMDFGDPPVVSVFGAGVAGLSVAHELAERGLKVRVYEPTESPTEEYSCQVGGMAANQTGRINVDPEVLKKLLLESGMKLSEVRIPQILIADSSSSMRPVQKCFPLTHRIRFKKDSKSDTGWLDFEDEFGTKNRDKLKDVLSRLRKAYKQYKKDQEIVERRLGLAGNAAANERSQNADKDRELAILQVLILGYTDTDGLPEQNRYQSAQWAELVRDALVELNAKDPTFSIPYLDKRLVIQGRGAEAPLGDQGKALDRQRSNRVEFQIIEQRIPGEHGYRFFPSFYRHLFDTMKRTPVFDKQGSLTAETAYDQLVDTPDPSIGFADGDALITVKLQRFTTLRDLQKTIEFFKQKAKFTDRDLLRLQTHFFKYLTSCKARRASEAEDVSFWEYIGADRVKYSDAAEDFINGTPQALVAMSAKETDARTQYNALIQMLVQNPLEEFIPDKTLNASTSEAWLNHWKAYLKRKGVEFFVGRLKRLEKQGDEFVPIVEPGPTPEYDNSDFDRRKGSNFFVMALPFPEASRITWEAWSDIKNNPLDAARFTGPFQQLRDFDIVTGRRTSGGAAEPRRRDPRTGQPTDARDPLRDISGIQYFMPANYRFGEGHVYYPNSPWALTSISQLAFWRDRVNPIGALVGQASVDIGDWYAPYGDPAGPQGRRPTAWNSTSQELADKTWNQVLEAIETEHAKCLVLPRYYHLDQGISFVGGTDLNGRATITAAFRASAILKIRGTLSGEGYKLALSGEREAPPINIIPAVRNTPEAFRNDLGTDITTSGVAVAEALDQDKLIISPLVTTRRALIAITGPSRHEFKVLLEDNPIVAPGTGEEIGTAKALFEAIKGNGPRGCTVAMHGDTTIAVSAKAPPDRHGSDQFSIAVFNRDNCIDLIDAPRLTLALDVPIDPKDGQPLIEIPAASLQHALVLDNSNPYIINVPGQWGYRPGQNATGGPPGSVQSFVWYESPTGSLFHRWVPAGTYMATYTRLTTMEAANESARHAVNAILHKILQSGFDFSREQGHLLGDFCEIWDPEDCEPPDVAPFKELDEALMREGLPHFLDIFRVIDLVENLPEDVSLAEAFEQLRKLADSQLSPVAAASLSGLDALLGAHLASLRMLLSGGLFR
jgi:NAD(P)-binding Rossmann-like domain